MVFKYKEIEVECKIQPSMTIIEKQKTSIINNKNIKIVDGVECKIHEIINCDEIEIIPTNDVEIKLLEELRRDTISTSTNTYISSVDPTIHSNLTNDTLNDDYVWINKTSGELFTCIDKTPDKNIWVGQLGTLIIGKDITIEGIVSEDMVAYFNYDKKSGNIIKSVVNNIEAISYGVNLSRLSVNGKAAYFNRDKLVVKNSELFSFTGDFTICIHIRPSGNNWTMDLFNKDKYNEFNIIMNTDLTISFSHGNSVDYKKYTSSLKLIKRDYNFMAITRVNGLVSIFIAHEFDELNYDNYVNMELFGNDFNDTTDITSSNKDLIIGDGDRGNFYGRLDDTYFFKRGLNIAELNIIKK